MKKIGYINNSTEYLEEYCENLYVSKLQGKTLEKKIDIIFNDKTILTRASNLSATVEVYRFYRLMLKRLTRDSKEDFKSHKLNKDIHLFGAYTSNKKSKGKKRHTVCAYLDTNNKKSIWMYSKGEKKMIGVSPEEFCYYRSKLNLQLVPGKYAEALKKLNNYVSSLKKVNNKIEVVR